ncbi:hypothetical protein [Marinobacter sp. OP 3.4]|uniref:hypothetical protein n=1 Tax=Marinobacter sp. OP 3.4 TaxID=3076501 RepID=UPI002E1DE28C
MWFLRGLLIIELLACLLLHGAKAWGWEPADESSILVWAFLFAFPMSVLGFVPALILLVVDAVRFRRRSMAIALGWVGFDVVMPVLNLIVFNAYYEQIGQM